jgi:hydroxypyruvate reductase/glycerate 2-kinase
VALEAAKSCAEEMGIQTYILTSRDKGEASEAAQIYAAIVKEIIYTQTPFKPPVLLLSGGELTVTLAPPPGKEPGKGGRNQAFALHMLKELKDVNHPFYIVSIGTDGLDGPTDAAGAWLDHTTAEKVKELNLNMNEYLEMYNSYRFFETIGQLIKTGPTRTNVMDMRMFYIPQADGLIP